LQKLNHLYGFLLDLVWLITETLCWNDLGCVITVHLYSSPAFSTYFGHLATSMFWAELAFPYFTNSTRQSLDKMTKTQNAVSGSFKHHKPNGISRVLGCVLPGLRLVRLKRRNALKNNDYPPYRWCECMNYFPEYQ